MYTIIYQDEKGFSALHSASNNGHTDIVKRLLDYKDIEVDIRDMVRLSFLQDVDYCIYNYHTYNITLYIYNICHLYVINNMIVVKKKSNTPLFRAIENGHCEIVRLLLDHKANVNAQNGVRANYYFYIVKINNSFTYIDYSIIIIYSIYINIYAHISDIIYIYIIIN